MGLTHARPNYERPTQQYERCSQLYDSNEAAENEAVCAVDQDGSTSPRPVSEYDYVLSAASNLANSRQDIDSSYKSEMYWVPATREDELRMQLRTLRVPEVHPNSLM